MVIQPHHCLWLLTLQRQSRVQFSSVAQSCPNLCSSMNCSTPGLPAHHQLPESTQTHVHRVSDATQPSHPLSSPSPAFNLPQHQGLFKWVSSLHQVAKGLEFQLQHQPFQSSSCVRNFRDLRICGSASLVIFVLKGGTMRPSNIVPLNQKLSLSPGHLELLMPVNQQAKMEVSVLPG